MRTPALCGAALLMGCVATKGVRNPNPAVVAPAVPKIAVMPVQTLVVDFDFAESVTSARSIDAAAAAEIAATLRQRMSARGADMFVARIDDALFAREPELRFQLTRVQKGADAAAERAYRFKLSKQTSPVGDFYGLRPVLAELQPLAAKLDADELLFASCRIVNHRTQVNTPTGYADAQILLVDATSGELLSAGRVHEESSFGFECPGLVEKAFDSME
jgi:hypothetical protein